YLWFRLFDAQRPFKLEPHNRALIQPDLFAFGQQDASNNARPQHRSASHRAAASKATKAASDAIGRIVMHTSENDDRRADAADAGCGADILQSIAAARAAFEGAFGVALDLFIAREIGGRFDDRRKPLLAVVEPDALEGDVQHAALERTARGLGNRYAPDD